MARPMRPQRRFSPEAAGAIRLEVGAGDRLRVRGALHVLRVWALLALAWASASVPRQALGAPMDPALTRLVLDRRCADVEAPCQPDVGALSRLVAQLGPALMPTPATAARTVGGGGFRVGVQSSVTTIDASADYWRRGTRGDAPDLSPGGQNADPPSQLQLHVLTVSKGLGWGVQLSGLMGAMPDTRWLSAAARLQVSVLEGLDRGRWRWAPDVSVAGTGWRSTTTGDLNLAGWDLEMRASKRLLIAADTRLSPWVGVSQLALRADSERVDFSPELDALSQCDYLGPASSGAPGRGPSAPADGGPICRLGAQARQPLDDSSAFPRVRLVRRRVLLGAGLGYGAVQLAAQLLFDLTSPQSQQSTDRSRAALGCAGDAEPCTPVERQWTATVGLAARF